MVCLGLQKETLGVLEAPVLVVSLPELCARPTAPGAERGCLEHPSSGTGQELLLQGCCSAFPSGLIVLVCRELLMAMQMLQGAPDANADVAGSRISTVGTTNTPGAAPAQGSPAAPENQSKEGNKKRGLQTPH